MKHTARLRMAAIPLSLSGCVDVSVGDALSAGIFDFISGTVAAILSGLLPV